MLQDYSSFVFFASRRTYTRELPPVHLGAELVILDSTLVALHAQGGEAGTPVQGFESGFGPYGGCFSQSSHSD